MKLHSSHGDRIRVTADDYSHQAHEKRETLFLFPCDLVVLVADSTSYIEQH